VSVLKVSGGTPETTGRRPVPPQQDGHDFLAALLLALRESFYARHDTTNFY